MCFENIELAKGHTIKTYLSELYKMLDKTQLSIEWDLADVQLVKSKIRKIKVVKYELEESFSTPISPMWIVKLSKLFKSM